MPDIYTNDLPIPEGEPDLRRSDVGTFSGRFPDPSEILRWGGRPGVKYLMIDHRNLHQATQPAPTDGVIPKGERWQLCKDVPIYTVEGPTGSTTIMILSYGTPIPGADPANGIREWFYDRTILTATGLKSPYGGAPDAQTQETPARSPARVAGESSSHPA